MTISVDTVVLVALCIGVMAHTKEGWPNRGAVIGFVCALFALLVALIWPAVHR